MTPEGPEFALSFKKPEGSLEDALVAALESPDRAQRLEAVAAAARLVDPEKLVAVVGDHENADRRNAAMEALVRAGARGVPTVIRALDDADPEVVLFAAGILGKSGDAAAIPHLVRLLERPEINVVQQAIDSLGELRASVAVEGIVKVVDRDPWLKFAAVHALGEIGDARAVEPLASLVGDEVAGEAAIEALGKIGTPEALGHLAKLLRESEDTPTFTACLRAIGEVLEQQPDEASVGHLPSLAPLEKGAVPGLAQRLMEMFESGTKTDPALRGAAIEMIRALRLRPLYVTLVMAGHDPELRERLQFCAVSIGKELAPALLLGLHGSNAHVCAFACECLGLLDMRDAQPDILMLLYSPDAGVRTAAVTALGRFDDESCLPYLVRLLGDPAESVRQACVSVILRMNTEAVTEALLSHLEPLVSGPPSAAPDSASADPRGFTTKRPPSPGAQTQPPPAADGLSAQPPSLPQFEGGSEAHACAGGLEFMRAKPSPRQYDFIITCLSHEEAIVRAAAVRALAQQRSDEGLGFLQVTLYDAEADVRAEVVSALGASRDRRARDILLEQIESNEDVLDQAVRALARLGDPTVAPRLIELYPRTEPLVRITIIEALAELREVAAEPVLARLLNDPEPAIRSAAVRALGSYATKTALRHVLGATRDAQWSVRAAAVRVLAGADSAAAQTAIERLCLDPSPEVAKAARKYRDERLRSRNTERP